MPSIADTIRRFQATQAGAESNRGVAGSGHLQPLSSFGTNPGGLNGWFFAQQRSDPMALVVVLHGCTQTAAAYDHGSGWSDLAERFGFAVLFPEQTRANNPNLCFNWFRREDIGRDGGEALSIRQMIGAMVERHAIDPDRVFVTGLSAGGAMANVMLATYPDLFAGGSIIAGLPYGSATSVSEALEVMRGKGRTSPDAIRAAAPRAGRWPSVSVWHGDADRTVDIANADAIVDQWRGVHGLASAPDRTDLVEGQRHRVWLDRAGLDRDGAIAIEEYRIAGLSHGTPLKTGGPQGCGNAGAYMLEAGISSTWAQAQRWGLLGGVSASSAVPAPPLAAEPGPKSGPGPTPSARPQSASDRTRPTTVGATIERALKEAGLMR